MRNKLIFNIGLIYAIVYFCFFLIFPLLLGILNIFVDESIFYSLVADLYLCKGLSFLTSKSLVIILIGLTSFIIGYNFYQNTYELNRNKLIEREWPLDNLMILSGFLFFLGFVSKIKGILAGAHLHFHFSNSIIDSNLITFLLSFNILHIISYFFIVYGFYKARELENALWKRRFLIVLIPMTLLILFGAMNFSGKLLLISTVLSIYIIHSKFKNSKLNNIKSLFFIFIIFILLFMLKGFLENEKDTSISQVLSKPLGRLSQTHIVTEIVIRSDNEVNNIFLKEFFENLKPKSYREEIVNGNLFAHDYDLLAINDKFTGVGMTVIGSLYYDYKLLGVLFGMFLVGIILRILSTFFNTDNGVVLYALLLPKILVTIEQNIANFFLTLGLLCLLYFLIHLIIMRNGMIDKIKYLSTKG